MRGTAMRVTVLQPMYNQALVFIIQQTSPNATRR
jgi:hypothetical protein